jgi:hypothetical protein
MQLHSIYISYWDITYIILFIILIVFVGKFDGLEKRIFKLLGFKPKPRRYESKCQPLQITTYYMQSTDNPHTEKIDRTSTHMAFRIIYVILLSIKVVQIMTR